MRTSRTRQKDASKLSLDSLKEPRSTRDLLLDVAQQVFARKGYEGTTVQDLAHAADVNVGLISYYFDGKKGLYHACLERISRARLLDSAMVLSDPESPEDFRVKIKLWIQRFLVLSPEEENLIIMMHREYLCSDPALVNIFKETFGKSFNIMIKFLTDAQKRRIISANADPHITATMIFGGLVHIVRTDPFQREHYGRSFRDPKYRDKVIQQATDLLMKGTSL